MNYEYAWLYRPRLFSFDLNFYSQFIPSRKNQPNEPMNYDRARDEQGRWNFHALSRATEPADFNLLRAPPVPRALLLRIHDAHERYLF